MKRRYLDYILALVVILSLNFFLPRLMPGDPLTAIYGDALLDMSPELQAQLAERYGLEGTLGEQFIAYVTNLLRGDLGYSYYFGAPVTEVILEALPWTLLLVGSSLLISTFIGVLIGIESGWRHGGRLDSFLIVAVMFLNGIPSFFMGILLLLFLSFQLHLFPLSGAVTPFSGYTGMALVMDILRHLFLPCLALTLVQIPRNFLLMRNSMIGVIRTPYILTAQGKGLKERVIQYRHAARGALLPIITRLGMSIGLLFTGVLFIETVFAYPGTGYIFYLALGKHDFPMVQGTLFFITLFVLAANFLTDVISAKIDPRLREHAYQLLDRT